MALRKFSLKWYSSEYQTGPASQLLQGQLRKWPVWWWPGSLLRCDGAGPGCAGKADASDVREDELLAQAVAISGARLGRPAGRGVGLVGSGGMNLNPTVVTMGVHARPQGSRLLIRGAAMEGLIKQRAAAKAAKRLAAALAPEAPEAPEAAAAAANRPD